MNNETDTGDAQFDAMMEQEAARPDLAPPPPEPDEGDLTPGDMLAATVEAAKADAAVDPAPPAPPAPARVEFTAEDYLKTRERAEALEKRLAEIEKQGAAAKDQAAEKAGLFEDPEGWEAQQQARIDAKVAEAVAGLRTQALDHDLQMTRARMDPAKYEAMDKAVSERAAADPQFAAQLRALSPYGAGAALEKWYDQNEAILNPTAYEARLREKWLVEQAGGAPNEPPAGQKPATGANAAGENVVRLPKSLSRQPSGRAATAADDGDDSEAAIFAVGANPRRA